MKETLEERNVAVEFAEVTDEGVFVGYRTQRIDAAKLVAELRNVVTTILDHHSATSVTGVILHNDRPIIGRWTVEQGWATRYGEDDLSEDAVTALVLHTLETVLFV